MLKIPVIIIFILGFIASMAGNDPNIEQPAPRTRTGEVSAVRESLR